MLWLVFVISLIVRTFDLLRPFGRGILSSGTSHFWHLAAENINNYGWLESIFCPIINTGINFEPNLYINHPSLTAFILSILFKIFGSSFLVTKIFALISWYLVSYLIYLIVKKESQELALYSCIASLLLPIINCYGTFIDSMGGPLILVFSLFFIYCLEYEKPHRLVFISLFLAAFTEWTFAPLLIACIFIPRYKVYRKTLIMGLVSSYTILLAAYSINAYRKFVEFSPASFELLVNSFNWFINDGYRELYNFASEKLANRSFDMQVSSSNNPWKTIIIDYWFYLFSPLFFPAIIIFFYKKAKNYLALSIQALFLIVLFPGGNFVHPYWSIIIIPIASIAIGQLLITNKRGKYLLLTFLVVFSSVYSYKYKNVNYSSEYEQDYKFIKNHSKPNQIVLLKPRPGLFRRGDRLLLGWNSKRDIIMVNTIPEAHEIMDANPSLKYKLVNLARKERLQVKKNT